MDSHNQIQQGKFITLEGGEGCGKSTQACALSTYLKDQGYKVHLTREPGGTELAEHIRALLVTGRENKMSALTEYLLFSAARNDHLEKCIIPLLNKGVWVISDRYIDSSVVYQGCVQNLDQKFMWQIFDHLFGEKKMPDITFYLDLDPRVGLARSSRIDNQESRFENKGLEFHEHVRVAFKQRAQNDPSRIHLINGNQNRYLVTQDMIDALKMRSL